MNPVCGDTLALMLRIEDGRIAEARFQTEGCTASLATSSLITEMVTGLTIDESPGADPRGRLGGSRRPAVEQAAQRRPGDRRATPGDHRTGQAGAKLASSIFRARGALFGVSPHPTSDVTCSPSPWRGSATDPSNVVHLRGEAGTSAGTLRLGDKPHPEQSPLSMAMERGLAGQGITTNLGPSSLRLAG